MELIKRSLPVSLTDQDRLDIAEQMSKTQQEINAIEDQKKRLNPLRADLARLSNQFEKNEKEELVECYWVYDSPEPGEKTMYRYDTGDVVERRLMTEEDSQGTLEFYKESEPEEEIPVYEIRLLENGANPLEMEKVV